MNERMLSDVAMRRITTGKLGMLDGFTSIIRHMANAMNDTNADNCKYTMSFCSEDEEEDESVIIPEVIISLRCGKIEER